MLWHKDGSITPIHGFNEQIAMGISSFSSVLLDLHLDRKIATPLAAITGLLLAGVLMWLWRNSSTLTLFAIAATTGRLWAYHRPYDDVMLIFLIVALGKLVMTHRSIGTVFAFCLVGLSLWAPFPKRTIPLPLQIAHHDYLVVRAGDSVGVGAPISARSKIRSTLMNIASVVAAAPGASRGIRSVPLQRARSL